jgi:hypothetical protein
MRAISSGPLEASRTAAVAKASISFTSRLRAMRTKRPITSVTQATPRALIRPLPSRSAPSPQETFSLKIDWLARPRPS